MSSALGFVTHLREVCEDLVSLGVEYHEALVEVVVLHRRGRVELGQARARLDLEGVVRAPVVEVVAQAGNHQGEALHLQDKQGELEIGLENASENGIVVLSFTFDITTSFATISTNHKS